MKSNLYKLFKIHCYDLPYESKHEWEWAFWKTIKLKEKHVEWYGYDPSAPTSLDE